MQIVFSYFYLIEILSIPQKITIKNYTQKLNHYEKNSNNNLLSVHCD
jgi:hypothetical protein